ncbi:hypothetical protein DFJ77DRAFT_530622 [Powellomyces hirtus]|nr:hypothetical protein DFJ77DRAFT_530622 [Powellomyces hirtus]
MAASAHPNAPVINPEISTPQDDVEDLVNGFLSSEKLIALTGAQDLNNVHFLEMKVDIRRTSLGSLGKLLPELQHIKLNNSYIPSIRDIGSGFTNLTVLWMARCDLSDLDGIASMFSLEEVYLAHNEISDLSSLGMLEALQVLDLEGNAVEDLEQIEYLGLCSMLRQLTISNNPLRLDSEDDGGEDEQPPKLRRKQARYGAEIRHSICTSLPQIAILDDVPVTARDRLPLSETLRVEPGRPSSSSCTPRRPRTAGGGGGRLSTPSRYAPSNEDASSDLTHGSGQIMAGNPILFLRTRRASNRSRANTPPSESLVHTDKDAPPTPVIMKPSLPHPQTATPPPHTSSFASNPPALLSSSVSTAPSTSPAPMLIPTSFAPRPPSATRPATADPHSSPSYPSHPQLPASIHRGLPDGMRRIRLLLARPLPQPPTAPQLMTSFCIALRRFRPLRRRRLLRRMLFLRNLQLFRGRTSPSMRECRQISCGHADAMRQNSNSNHALKLQSNEVFDFVVEQSPSPSSCSLPTWLSHRSLSDTAT